MASFDIDEDAPFYFDSLIRFSYEDPFDSDFQQQVKYLHEACQEERCKCVQKIRAQRLLTKREQWLCSTEQIANLIISASPECDFCEVDSDVAVLPQERTTQAWDLAYELLQRSELSRPRTDEEQSEYSNLIINPNSKYFGKSLLHIAVESGYEPAVKYLFCNFPELAFISSATEDYITPVELAVRLEKDDISAIFNDTSNISTKPQKSRILTSSPLLLGLKSDASLLKKDLSRKTISLIVGSESQVEFASHLVSSLQAVRPRQVVIRCNYFEHSIGREKWQSTLCKSDALICLMSDELKESINEQQCKMIELKKYGFQLPLFGELLYNQIEKWRKRSVFYYVDENHLPEIANANNSGTSIYHGGRILIEDFSVKKIGLRKIKRNAKSTMIYVDEIESK